MPISYRAAQSLIKRGDEPALHAALSTGLDPNLANHNGWTLLMLAAVEGAVPLATLLLSRGANPAAQNKSGDTALTIAQHRGYTLLVDLFNSHAASAT